MCNTRPPESCGRGSTKKRRKKDTIGKQFVDNTAANTTIHALREPRVSYDRGVCRSRKQSL